MTRELGCRSAARVCGPSQQPCPLLSKGPVMSTGPGTGAWEVGVGVGMGATGGPRWALCSHAQIHS